MNQTASVAINEDRKDYGIKYNKLLETGVPDVSDEIELEINAEAIRDTLPKDTTAN